MYLFIIVIVGLLSLNVESNQSAIYFPPDDSQDLPVRNNIAGASALSEKDLEVLRGTSVYEQFVDDIISRGIARLTVELNRLLKSRAGNNENVLISPVSISVALALVMLGSNGATFKEISQIWGLHVGIPDIDKKSQIVHEQFGRMLRKVNRTSGFDLGDEVSVASALFVQSGYPIRPIYRDLSQSLYDSNVVDVDFVANPQSAQQIINNWVEAKTNNRIKNILSEPPPTETTVIMTSALYFKAEWDQHFISGITKRRPFFVDGRQSPTNIETDMMANGGDFPYYRDDVLGCEILGLPYKGKRSTMYVVIPFNSSRQTLLEFEAKLTANDLNRLVSNTAVTQATVLFPKMKIDSTISLRETLKFLGVKSLFDKTRANLALLSDVRSEPLPNNIPKNTTKPTYENIDHIRQLINAQSSDNNYQNPGLYASDIIHKVFMEVTEKGTEAAAATAVILTKSGDNVSLRVDVPFCFFIRHDDTRMILFWGSIVTPNPSYKIN